MRYLDDFRAWSATVTGRHARTWSAFLDALARRRPAWMLSLAFAEANLSEGLRAACASTAMLLLGQLMHEPDFSYAAIGAFWTCLADAAGTSRMRFASMTAFAFLSTLCGGLTAWASGLGAAPATAAVLVFSTLGAGARIFGAAASQVAILGATACVVMVDRPMHGGVDDARFLLLYFLGCAFATLLSFTIWRIHPFGPPRAALRAAYLRLADMARDCARLLESDDADAAQWAAHASTFRGQARGAVETARAALGKMPSARTDRRRTYGDLLIALANSEQIFAYLIAVTDACERSRDTLPNPRRAARALNGIAATLQRLAEIVTGETGELSTEPHERLHALGKRLDAAIGERTSLEFCTEPAEVEAAAPLKDWRAALLSVLRRAGETVKANASIESIGMRHAARVGVATTLAFLIVRALQVPFGYWATMATLLILQPSLATSWTRSVERAAGSVAGALFAAGLGLFVHTPLAISLFVFPLVCATMALRTVSYALFVFFITPSFVLVADFAASVGAGEFVHAATRLGNNVLGCVIALAATFLLWPSREPASFDDKLARAISANLAYLAAALARARIADAEIERARRAAGLASNNAEETLARLRLERLNTSATEEFGSTALALLRRIAGTATRARLTVGVATTDERLVAWVRAVAHALDARLTANERAEALRTFPTTRLTRLETDAVNQVIVLSNLLEQAKPHPPSGLQSRSR
ncbi:FUSC family protein [Caballeronia humi]|uniref:Membrane protein-like protein n=1 Tax=Caballeronia humi TaxID=326474 RepID=A0A158GJZ2_9BURK|nr:FUSC family protein [Caballeronia humi]SAL32352.1 membrane protein-like protein [Caballeronia humi]